MMDILTAGKYLKEKSERGEIARQTIERMAFAAPIGEIKQIGGILKKAISTIKKPPIQAVEAIGLKMGIPSKSRVAISLPETRSQELFTSLKASKPESVSTILNVPPSQFTNRSFIQGYYNTVKKISQETLPISILLCTTSPSLFVTS